MEKYRKQIIAFGQPLVIACDGKCASAFGVNGRPHEQLSDDPDDIVWYSDKEAGVAPESGKTVILAEGGECKPSNENEVLNKWCFRECERCEKVDPGKELIWTDWSQRVYNKPQA